VPENITFWDVDLVPDGRVIYSVTLFDQQLHSEKVDFKDAALCATARVRLRTIAYNIALLGGVAAHCELLLRKLPGHLQLRSQIMTSSPGGFVEFCQTAPYQQQMEPEQRRDRFAPPLPDTPMREPAVPRARAPRPRRPYRKGQYTVQVGDAQHQAILAQFKPPRNKKGIFAGRIGDDWEELLLDGKNRLVGWQWFKGYARRIIKSPTRKTGLRALHKLEELAVLRAGLKLDHDEGRGQDEVKDS
jgi:hypothetical protein